MLDEDWSVTPVTKRLFDKARAQLGTSGSGNHFAEFGVLTLDKPDLGMQPGQYLAFLTHSGSRGSGATVADFYSKLAMEPPPRTPAGTAAARVARHGHRGRPGVLGRHEPDGQVRRRQPRGHPPQGRQGDRGEGAGGRRESPQLLYPRHGARSDPGRAGFRLRFGRGGRCVQFRPGTRTCPREGEGRLVGGAKANLYDPDPAPEDSAFGQPSGPDLAAGAREWVEAEKLRPGDRVVCAEGYFRRDLPMPVGHARFIGAFLGDGWVRATPPAGGTVSGSRSAILRRPTAVATPT